MNFINEENKMCDDCSIFQKAKREKTKEILIKNILDENEFKYQTYDKVPKDSCFKYRPDFLFDLLKYIIILEVDEHQHSGYECECEQARMINLYQDQGGMDTIFLRVNPDSYVDNDGNEFSKWNASRTKLLVKVLNSLILHPPADGLNVIYLFYDGFDKRNIEVKQIDIDHLLVNEMEKLTISDEMLELINLYDC